MSTCVFIAIIGTDITGIGTVTVAAVDSDVDVAELLYDNAELGMIGTLILLDRLGTDAVDGRDTFAALLDDDDELLFAAILLLPAVAAIPAYFVAGPTLTFPL